MTTLTPFNPTANDWDAFVCAQADAHALQLSAWGELKAAYGWQVERVALADGDGRIAAGAQVLLRPLPARLGTMGYIPFAPYAGEPGHYPALWDAIRQRLKPHNAAFLKVEPGFPPVPDFAAWGFRPSPQTVQPPNTILIDLSDDEDAIMARMNQGTRRKIRTAEKKDVRVIRASRDDLPRFTAMMQATGERNTFGVHEPGYYARAYDLFVPSGRAQLFLAEHEGDTLAGIFAFAVGSTAWYLYGASSDVKRNLMGSYAAQWSAMMWAKHERACTTYDLWGIPDADEATLEAGFQERSDGLWGVYGSKRGWGGQVVRTVGAWDMPLNPLLYHAYRLALRVRG